MTDTDLLELENPPDIVVNCYPRFAEAVGRCAATLRQHHDDRAKIREELASHRAQVSRILAAAGTDSVDEVVERLNGGRHDETGDCGLCHEEPKAPGDWVCPGCREHLDGLSPRTKKGNQPGGGRNHGWLAERRAVGGY